jgi:hypothetical protein
VNHGPAENARFLGVSSWMAPSTHRLDVDGAAWPV